MKLKFEQTDGEDLKILDGTMTGDMRSGPVHIDIKDPE